MGIFRFVQDHSEGIFWLAALVIMVGGMIKFISLSDAEREAKRQSDAAAEYKVYCVAKSGEVLFDGQVADATASNGRVIIRYEDYSKEYITITGDCRIIPVRKNSNG